MYAYAKKIIWSDWFNDGGYITDIMRVSCSNQETEKHIPSLDINSEIKKVIFNDRTTIVLWKDGTKTVVKCQPEDTFSEEVGLAMCIIKKLSGNSGNYNNVFKKWCHEGDSFE